MSLKVIGAGFGRTGTTSLKSALEQLGFEPSYHMAEVVGERPGVNDGHLDAWHAFLCRGVVPDWRQMFIGYRACTDSPTCVFYRELMDAFPDARVVLTVREPASWYASVTALREMTSRLLGATAQDARMQKFGEFMGALERRAFVDPDSREATMKAFSRHNDEVRATVPSERLLVYDIRQGWGPLCDFLECPTPTVDFPNLNDRELLESMPEAVASGDQTLAEKWGKGLQAPKIRSGEGV
jgi:hypothetical protein